MQERCPRKRPKAGSMTSPENPDERSGDMETPAVLRRITLLFLILLAASAGTGGAAEKDAADVAAAQAVFDKNSQAIRPRDRATYLSCYLDSEGLARTRFEGPQLGFQSFADCVGQRWP